MSPSDGFLDFRRGDPMPGNMAGIVQIPIEAFCAIQHNHSIYNYCMYRKSAGIGREQARREQPPDTGRRENRPRPFSLRPRMDGTPATDSSRLPAGSG